MIATRTVSLYFILCFFSFQAQAAAVFYTDETAFNSAVGTAAGTASFEGLAPFASLSTQSAGYTEDGVTMGAGFAIISAGIPRYDVGRGDSAQVSPNVTMPISYSSDFFAAGMYIYTVRPDGFHADGLVRITLDTGEFLDVATTIPDGQDIFLGFTSDTAITSFDLVSISVSSGNNRRWLEVDEISIYTSASSNAAVPVPAGAWLFLLGLAGLMRRLSASWRTR